MLLLECERALDSTLSPLFFDRQGQKNSFNTKIASSIYISGLSFKQASLHFIYAC